jgi:hypothetical protein
LKIIGSVSTETVFDINLNQTDLPQNTAAGYDDPTSNPIPVLSGMPSLTPDGNGDYPVSDTFSVSPLEGGTITVSADDVVPGDVDGIEGVDIRDVRYLLFAVYGFEGYTIPTDGSADVDGIEGVDIRDVRYLLFNVYGFEGYTL